MRCRYTHLLTAFTLTSSLVHAAPTDNSIEPVFTHLKRQGTAPVVKGTNFTYVPPPKTDVTQELLQQSLLIQPQDTATVSSIVPQFRDGVIMFGIQLNGPVAAMVTLNASTTLPCDTIGTATSPDLVLRPKVVVNGTATPVIPDCQIIAVNMYNPLIITYWVQRQDGGIFSLAGNNKVERIDRIDTSQSVALVVRARITGNLKRRFELESTVHGQQVSRRAIAERAIAPIDTHTATMSAEACAAIKCINNGGKAALFNPFTSTCGCAEPVLVEIDRST